MDAPTSFRLSVIAFEMLTGEKPFSGEHLTTVVYKIVAGDPIPPRRLNPTLGAEIEAVLAQGAGQAAGCALSELPGIRAMRWIARARSRKAGPTWRAAAARTCRPRAMNRRWPPCRPARRCRLAGQAARGSATPPCGRRSGG